MSEAPELSTKSFSELSTVVGICGSASKIRDLDFPIYMQLALGKNGTVKMAQVTIAQMEK